MLDATFIATSADLITAKHCDRSELPTSDNSLMIVLSTQVRLSPAGSGRRRVPSSDGLVGESFRMADDAWVNKVLLALVPKCRSATVG